MFSDYVLSTAEYFNTINIFSRPDIILIVKLHSSVIKMGKVKGHILYATWEEFQSLSSRAWDHLPLRIVVRLYMGAFLFYMNTISLCP